MGAVAVACVALGIGGIDVLIPVGAAAMMLAPLAALGGVAVAAAKARDRLAGYALGALLVIALGMVLAR